MRPLEDLRSGGMLEASTKYSRSPSRVWIDSHGDFTLSSPNSFRHAGRGGPWQQPQGSPDGRYAPTSYPPTLAILDLVEFCFDHVAEPTRVGHHDFYRHDHLRFDQTAGRSRWRSEAREQLWDAFERSETILDPDKKTGSTALRERAASSPELANQLTLEARALTTIGNDFKIRHHETNKAPVEIGDVDYL
jgi:hypothetical protein